MATRGCYVTTALLLWCIHKQLQVSWNLNDSLVPSYPVAVEQLDGSEDVKLASHEELDGQFPGQR